MACELAKGTRSSSPLSVARSPNLPTERSSSVCCTHPGGAESNMMIFSGLCPPSAYVRRQVKQCSTFDL